MSQLKQSDSAARDQFEKQLADKLGLEHYGGIGGLKTGQFQPGNGGWPKIELIWNALVNAEYASSYSSIQSAGEWLESLGTDVMKRCTGKLYYITASELSAYTTSLRSQLEESQLSEAKAKIAGLEARIQGMLESRSTYQKERSQRDDIDFVVQAREEPC